MYDHEIWNETEKVTRLAMFAQVDFFFCLLKIQPNYLRIFELSHIKFADWRLESREVYDCKVSF